MPDFPIFDRFSGKSYKMPWDGPDKPDPASIKNYIFDQEHRSVFQKTKDWMGEKIGDTFGSTGGTFGTAPSKGPWYNPEGRPEGGLQFGDVLRKMSPVEKPRADERPVSVSDTAASNLASKLPSYLQKPAGMLGSLAGQGVEMAADPMMWMGTKSGSRVLSGRAAPGIPDIAAPPTPTARPPATPTRGLRLGTGELPILDAQFQTLPDIQLPPSPVRAELPAAPPIRYGGRRGVGSSLEDVADTGLNAASPEEASFNALIPERYKPTPSNLGTTEAFPYLKDTSQEGFYGTGALENIPEAGTPPGPKRRVAQPKMPEAKGAENVADRPFAKSSDSDIEFLVDTGDSEAIAEAKQRPSLRQRLFGETGAIGPGELPPNPKLLDNELFQKYKNVPAEERDRALKTLGFGSWKELLNSAEEFKSRPTSDLAPLPAGTQSRLRELGHSEDAIRSMSIDEANSILKGGEGPAVSSLRQQELLKKFGGKAEEINQPGLGKMTNTVDKSTVSEPGALGRMQDMSDEEFLKSVKKPISRLNKLMGDETGAVNISGEGPSPLRKSFREVYDDMATSGLTVIRNLGGRDLEELLLRNRLDGEQLAGRLNSKLKDITKGLTQEELDNYINVRDVGARPLNQNVKDAFEQFKSFDSSFTQMAKKSGMGLKRGSKIVPFEGLGKEGEHFAHIYGPEFFKDKEGALNSIMKEGYTLEQAERILKKASEHGERLIDPQHGRTVNAPGYRKDINVDYQHINDMSKRIKEAIDFGPLDTADANSPISRMVAATDDPARVGKIVKRYLGREEPMNPAWARVNSSIVNFQTATKLSKFLINNIASLGMDPVMAGFKNTGKALAETIFDYPGARSKAEVTGALQPIYKELVQEAGGPKGITKWFGVAKGEEFNRTVSAIAGKHTANDLFEKLKANPENPRLRKRVQDLILQNPDDLLKQGKLSDWQVNRAGARMSEITQGRASNIDLPKLWSDTPAARLVMLYKRYAFQQSKNIKRAFDVIGPAKTAAILAGTSAVLGEGLGDVNAVLKGTGRTIGGAGNLEDEISKAIAARGEGYKRIINNLAQAWALGYIGDLFDSSGRSKEGTAANLAGPVVGDIGETAYNIGNLNAKGLAAQGARMIPLFGTGIASAISESSGGSHRKGPPQRKRRR